MAGIPARLGESSDIGGLLIAAMSDTLREWAIVKLAMLTRALMSWQIDSFLGASSSLAHGRLPVRGSRKHYKILPRIYLGRASTSTKPFHCMNRAVRTGEERQHTA